LNLLVTSLKPGDPAPAIELPDQDGSTVSLSDHRGRWTVVYFYPADDTPGCTAESCSFRDSHEDFVEAGAVVIGISGDSAESHRSFADKHRLPFTLLADEDGAARRAFGVTRSFGVLPGRVTYVIDPDGVIQKVFASQFRPKKHMAEALAAIRAG
jgi:thioredoxin-dependent peroxiredoxin